VITYAAYELGSKLTYSNGSEALTEPYPNRECQIAIYKMNVCSSSLGKPEKKTKEKKRSKDVCKAVMNDS
jgi:hypothetical protein